MADWYAIRIQIDGSPSPAVLQGLMDRMKAEDYDFPPSCLRYDDWFTYRSPIGGGAFIGPILTEAGLTGRYWLIYTDADNCSDADMRDEYIVEFGPGVEPLARSERHRANMRRTNIRNSAQRYVDITRGLGASPIPVRRAVLPLLNIFIAGDFADFEAAVAELASQDDPPTT